ncbi:hypothetical protein SLS60_002349 [Paraconiothyrium brasiliense]|uniref:Uncharacterized protein n=1 Tax=Paraconiothyrium brasiliense TaxID=300254 RepID=A0ABR3S2Z5_9PLEO
MDFPPVCESWSAKGRRTFDPFSRGPARFILVNDGESKVPALLLSQSMFKALDRAATVSQEFGKERKAGREKSREHRQLTRSRQAELATIDFEIEHLKRTLERGDREMDKAVTSRLCGLNERKFTLTGMLECGRRIRERMDKDQLDLDDRLSNEMYRLGVVIQELWERAGIFDTATDQHMSRDKPTTIGDVEQRAYHLLSQRHKSVEEARKRYEDYLQHREQMFLDWIHQKGFNCTDQYDLDEKRDLFRRNDHRDKATELCRDMEEHKASYTKAYEVCRQLGLEVTDLPEIEAENHEDIIQRVNRDIIDSFEHNRHLVDAWMDTPPKKDDERTVSQAFSQSGDTLHPGHSLSCDMPLSEAQRHITEYEELRTKAQRKAMLEIGEKTSSAKNVVSTTVPEGAAPRPGIQRGKPAVKPPPGDASGEAKNTVSIVIPPRAESRRRSKRKFPPPASYGPTPPTCFAIPPFGSFIRADDQVQAPQIRPWSSPWSSRGTIPDGGQGRLDLKHRKPLQKIAGRKRKFDEFNEDNGMHGLKTRKFEPSAASTTSPSGAPFKDSDIPLPLIDWWILTQSERQQSAEAEGIPSVPQESNGGCSDIFVQGLGHASSPNESSMRPPNSSSSTPPAHVVHVAPGLTIASSSTPPSAEISSAKDRSSTGSTHQRRTYGTIEEEDKDEL